jgi:hypothetical protein
VCKNALTSSSWIIDPSLAEQRAVNAAGCIGRKQKKQKGDAD